ncbi:transcriptional regulator with XRE-family HTH domain [Clostridium tetanomorphum]|uniref:Helix-turn-helix transcriptional regulator n=1 Tax=Clostridium tetanomorphum TaxID=1553 RepID=A0A923E823_CLOTT|nr:helix-turn-helix transcriptional regulator [Clostridium tetanomorphum]KAJ51150.1 putative DNA-binding protein [Clostridium tetanomorphum DSM 665]MBC2398158.1 helix-turn-helix transcriptional regulator [Clostridium tetanomorphum]MBP1864421.1 transcriptional regulator with XRE-family HTH domain [Clostridium tetanomorphum]NRS83048.1 transcriptional regulator with XRE-family HTH domain [Clostridium tetanomorphum]NRZ98855.1 transcriptional regulator with XRE-family HTH domain [Clostridium tetano
MLDGKKIREYRLKLGYTASDIENLTKNSKYLTSISKSYLEELERGDKNNPSLQKVVVLANILCCKLDDLIVH